MVIDINVDLVVLHVDLKLVHHGNEAFLASRRTRYPILAEICEHVDVITQEVEDWLV